MDTESRAGQQLAYASVPAHLRFWLVAGLAAFLDLWSKWKIFDTLDPDSNYPVIRDVLHFHRSLNDGAVFGSFTGQVWLFVAASIFALGFVTILFLRSHRRQWVTQVALALVMSGAIGNLYDRVFMQADVITFNDAQGVRRSFIGVVLEETDNFIRMGDWPDGSGTSRVVRSDSEPSLRRQGVVRDFIRFMPSFPQWVPYFGGREVWPWVFNIADAALVTGVIILFLISWFTGPDDELG